MAWAVRLPDGTTEKFATFEEAEEFKRELEATDPRSPEEIYDAAANPRVSRDVFLRRVEEGWSPHRAVDSPPEGRYAPAPFMRENRTRIAETMGAPTAHVHEAFGRSRTLRQWSEGCGISQDTLRVGARRHGSLEAYFEHIGWSPDTSRTVDPEFD